MGPAQKCTELEQEIADLKAEAAQRTALEGADAALRASEERYRTLVELSPDAVFVSRNDRIVFVNSAGVRLFGATAPEEILGRSPCELLDREDRPVMAERMSRLQVEQRVRLVEGRIVLSNGTVLDVEVAAAMFTDQEGPAIQIVVRDITDQKEAEAERERLVRELRDALQAKDQFVAAVSHELRNPLNAITSGLYLLRRTLPADERATRTLETVERNALLQARLINDLLDLSRLQRGKLTLQRAPTRLDRVVDVVAQAWKDDAQEAGLTLTVRAEPNLWVQGDEDRLQQVVMNLLTNATSFTPPPGEITVSVDAVDGKARLIVADTGIGISPELLPDLFGAFRQGEVGGQRAAGLGLGLALVKGIVERHGGDVWAESDGVGKGSQFIVELPLVTAPSVVTRTGGGEAQAVRVLVVEDIADMRTLVTEGLTLAGYEVRGVGSGEEGLDAVAEARPDVMLVDIGLPGMDGFEFLRRARDVPGMADVPALAVTGYGSEEDARRGREVGFLGHFVKPVDLGRLDKRIKQIVRGGG